MSDEERQLINKHMTKFKSQMSCKQYMKKPTKCCSKLGYLYEFDLYLTKRKMQSLGLRKQLLWICLRNYKIYTLCYILTFFLILQHWMRSFLIGELNSIKVWVFFGKNIEKNHLCRHYQNYLYFYISNISVINLIVG